MDEYVLFHTILNTLSSFEDCIALFIQNNVFSFNAFLVFLYRILYPCYNARIAFVLIAILYA